MQDLAAIYKNNPASFANNAETAKYLAVYSKSKYHAAGLISNPQKEQQFSFGGIGGIPINFDSATGKVYLDHTDKHSLIIGQTGSKKSRLFAIPTTYLLGLAEESMIISDPKAEIYAWTSEFLKEQGYNIKVINLRDPSKGHSWNPLALPYRYYKAGDIDRAYSLANDISVNLSAIDKGNNDPFWDDSAGSLFFGLTLLLFRYCSIYNEPDESVCIESMFELKNLLLGSEPESRTLWKFAKEDAYIASVLSGTIEAAVETRKSILSVFDQKMRVFSVRPSLLEMLKYDDRTFLSIDEKKTVVFLILPDEKTTYHGLVSLYIKQSYEYLISHAQEEVQNLRIRVNYILDEFSSLPQIADFPAMITAARSRNIRFNLFLQSKKQLIIRYKEDADTIMSNCENWFYLSSREIDFLQELSNLCGDHYGSNRRPLLSIADLQHLDKEHGQVLVLTARNKPMITQLPDISYYCSKSRATSFPQNGQIHIPPLSNVFKDRVILTMKSFSKQEPEKEMSASNTLMDLSPFLRNDTARKMEEEISGLQQKVENLQSEIDMMKMQETMRQRKSLVEKLYSYFKDVSKKDK